MRSDRIAPLDGLRGFAVLVVFACHTAGYPERGDLGVDIFFVLSGYLISAQLYGEQDRSGSIDLLRFYFKRMTRLFPAFIMVCLLYYLIVWRFPGSAPFVDPATLSSLLVTSNYYWVNGNPPAPFLQHTWSLALEWQFYFVWPVLVMIIARLGARRFLLPILIVGALAVVAAQWAGFRYLNFGGFILGAILALPRSFEPRRPMLLYFVLCSAIAILILLRLQDRIYSNLAVTILSAVLIFVVTSYPTAKWPVLDSVILRHFGKISYALYLYHFPVAAVMFVQGYSRPQMVLGGLLISIPLAELSWLLEARALRWRPSLLFPSSAASVA